MIDRARIRTQGCGRQTSAGNSQEGCALWFTSEKELTKVHRFLPSDLLTGAWAQSLGGSHVSGNTWSFALTGPEGDLWFQSFIR